MIKLETNYDKLNVILLILKSKLSHLEKAKLIMLDIFLLDYQDCDDPDEQDDYLNDIVNYDFGDDINAYVDAAASLRYDFYIWVIELNNPKYLKDFKNVAKKAISLIEKENSEFKPSKERKDFYNNVFLELKEKYLYKTTKTCNK